MSTPEKTSTTPGTKKTIVVTQEMIDQAEGMRNKSRIGFCPIALGVKKAFNSPCGYSGYRKGGVGRKKNPIQFDLPKEARRLIENFDNGLPASPLTFTVEVSA